MRVFENVAAELGHVRGDLVGVVDGDVADPADLNEIATVLRASVLELFPRFYDQPDGRRSGAHRPRRPHARR